MKRLKLRYLFLAGFLGVVIWLSIKPLLNTTGMCTAGPIGDWHYVTMEETLAFLNAHPAIGPKGEKAIYEDAESNPAPLDSFDYRNFMSMAWGVQRFSIKETRPWMSENGLHKGFGYRYSPNCLDKTYSHLF